MPLNTEDNIFFESSRENLLKCHSLLGKWKHGDGRWVSIRQIDDLPHGEFKKYSVIEFVRPYSPYKKYSIRLSEIEDKIKTLKNYGFKLIKLQYPELQEFFRNGEPVTSGTIFQDSFFAENNAPETKKMTGMEALLASMQD